MPLKGEAKREYQRVYMRREHGFAPRRVGKRDSKGDLDPTLDPVREEESLDPRKVSSLPNRGDRVGLGRTQDARWMRGYLAYLAAHGVTLVITSLGCEWVDVATGEVGVYGTSGLLRGLPSDHERIEGLEVELLATQQVLAALQVDISIQRAEAILDEHLREAEEEWRH